MNNNINNNIVVTEIRFPGDKTDMGVRYYGNNGNRWYADTSLSFDPTYINGDVIGTLLNMNYKNVHILLEFYQNEVHIGIIVISQMIYYIIHAFRVSIGDLRR